MDFYRKLLKLSKTVNGLCHPVKSKLCLTLDFKPETGFQKMIQRHRIAVIIKMRISGGKRIRIYLLCPCTFRLWLSDPESMTDLCGIPVMKFMSPDFLMSITKQTTCQGLCLEISESDEMSLWPSYPRNRSYHFTAVALRISKLLLEIHKSTTFRNAGHLLLPYCSPYSLPQLFVF